MKKQEMILSEELITALIGFLSRVSMSGLIDGCLLKCTQKTLTVQAVDHSSTAVVSARMPNSFGFPEGDFGLCSLSLILSYLSRPMKKVSVQLKSDSLILKGGSGSIKLPLVSADQVQTLVEQPVELSTLKSESMVQFVLTQNKLQLLLEHCNLLGAESVVFVLDENGSVIGKTNPNAINQFSLRLAKVDAGENSETSVEVYTQFLKSVTSSIPFPKGDDATVTVLFGKDRPLLFVLTEDDFWAVTPIQD